MKNEKASKKTQQNKKTIKNTSTLPRTIKNSFLKIKMERALLKPVSTHECDEHQTN